ncbi:hypothetical protein COCC4DRAFT_33835 [Bipolaris maydis ATCC 48331]|uniref:Uncharacterized protein n=2 Tax=Cochliobolus heterostrophus TaxID=5016 RepID=M2TBE3_COCH5|nr:uncharacterized protein COCC4DRAFT_33835 [Bipolaris maydis ATCC 48331]EMD94855.1 hypothetical protein COCHEDRAFT_1210870 [Bipolaris maydis C5]KAH7555961.1 hypothetical protein BM1_06487 [Bipolaris maydis]ENI01853.1 hypothetical protein COCC4DRAFT_33835 [Bipolaris maydis ATCC 48331]KAJ5029257.1 hypothetical protein J3E73DRAFT_29486 [Bipolaris maydis]KAJ5062006.1 hypothetical protein J3E74DRAFT_332010 [Bipolaris maydis]
MYSNTLIFAILAAASTTVAEFAIITTPLPTNLNVLTDLSAYKSSILSQVSSGLASLTGDPAAVSSAASAHKGLASFAATATYSIPPKVTEIGALETFSTTPVWYSALPTDVKAYYDEFNKEVQGLIDQAILGERKNETETQSGGSSPTGTSGGAGAKETGGASGMRSAVGVMGAGIAVAVAGVLAL